MQKKYLKVILAGAISVAAITTSYQLVKRHNQEVRLNRALQKVKELFEGQGEIIGSYLDATVKPYHHENFETKAYFGGIIRRDHDQTYEYKFVLSAKNYSLLDLKLIA